MEQKQDVVVCPACKGVGKEYRRNRDGTPYLIHGKAVTQPCSVCGGEGRLLRRITIEYFQIPQTIINASPEPEKNSLLETIKNKFKKPGC